MRPRAALVTHMAPLAQIPAITAKALTRPLATAACATSTVLAPGLIVTSQRTTRMEATKERSGMRAFPCKAVQRNGHRPRNAMRGKGAKGLNFQADHPTS